MRGRITTNEERQRESRAFWLEREWMVKTWYAQKVSIREIARRLGLSYASTYRGMKFLRIEFRGRRWKHSDWHGKNNPNSGGKVWRGRTKS